MIEAFSEAPDSEDFRACLSKHLAFWQQRARKERSDRKRGHPETSNASGDPFLWIIAAGKPVTLLDQFAAQAAPGWPTGVYFVGGQVLRVGIVVASALPHDGTTVLVRLMAAGPLLEPALRELMELPSSDYARSAGGPILLHLQRTLAQKPHRTQDEQEIFMAITKSLDDWRAEGRAEGKAEGKAEAHADALLTVLRVRGLAVPPTARERILAQKDADQLKRWLERAAVAMTIDDVFAGPA